MLIFIFPFVVLKHESDDMRSFFCILETQYERCGDFAAFGTHRS